MFTFYNQMPCLRVLLVVVLVCVLVEKKCVCMLLFAIILLHGIVVLITFADELLLNRTNKSSSSYTK